MFQTPKFEKKNEFWATLRSLTIPILAILIATIVGLHASGMYEVLIVLIGVIIVMCTLHLRWFSSSELKWLGISLICSGVISVFVSFHFLVALWNILSIFSLILALPGIVIIYFGRKALENLQNDFYEEESPQDSSRYRYPNPYRVTTGVPEPSFVQNLWERKEEILLSIADYLIEKGKDILFVLLAMAILLGDWILPKLSKLLQKHDTQDDSDEYPY